MIPFIKQITLFKEIQKVVNSSNENFNDSIINFYVSLGNDLGFVSKKDYSFSFNGLKMPPLNLAWLDNDSLFFAFEVNFSSKELIISSLFKLNYCDADYACLVFSSKAFRESFSGIKKILQNFKSINHDFLLIDISDEKFFTFLKNTF